MRILAAYCERQSCCCGQARDSRECTSLKVITWKKKCDWEEKRQKKNSKCGWLFIWKFPHFSELCWVFESSDCVVDSMGLAFFARSHFIEWHFFCVEKKKMFALPYNQRDSNHIHSSENFSTIFLNTSNSLNFVCKNYLPNRPFPRIHSPRIVNWEQQFVKP